MAKNWVTCLISAAWYCVVLAAGPQTRHPPLSIRVSQIVAKQPPSGPGWAHELKHDGCRLCAR
jgi:ATP-dependent DNA ligase